MGSDVEALNDAFAKPGAVSFVSHALGGPAAELVTPHASAQVALHGAHVLSFHTKTDSADVLWMSPEARIAHGQGIRGGIPVCWPWFAQHPEGGSKPDHGFVRKGPWRVAATGHDGERAWLQFVYDRPAETQSLWPAEADVSVTVSLSDRLRVDVTTRNTGDQAFALSQALHSYFAVGNIADVSIEGLDGRTYLDKVNALARATQAGAITFAGEVDRIYEDTADDVIIRDPGLRRAIRIAKEGSSSTVVWNPWVEKAKRLSDMPADGFLGMVCVETTNAGGDVITVKPGDTHRLTTILSVEAL